MNTESERSFFGKRVYAPHLEVTSEVVCGLWQFRIELLFVNQWTTLLSNAGHQTKAVGPLIIYTELLTYEIENL